MNLEIGPHIALTLPWFGGGGKQRARAFCEQIFLVGKKSFSNNFVKRILFCDGVVGQHVRFIQKLVKLGTLQRMQSVSHELAPPPTSKPEQ